MPKTTRVGSVAELSLVAVAAERSHATSTLVRVRPRHSRWTVCFRRIRRAGRGHQQTIAIRRHVSFSEADVACSRFAPGDTPSGL